MKSLRWFSWLLLFGRLWTLSFFSLALEDYKKPCLIFLPLSSTCCLVAEYKALCIHILWICKLSRKIICLLNSFFCEWFFFSNFSHNPSTLKNLEFWILFSKPSETAANANLFLAVLYLFFTVRISNSLRGSVASNIEFIALLCFHSPEDLVPHKRWILFSNVLIKKF